MNKKQVVGAMITAACFTVTGVFYFLIKNRQDTNNWKRFNDLIGRKEK